MTKFVAFICIGLLAGFLLDNAAAEDCKSGFNENMCHTFCMLNRLSVGTCRIVGGRDKCHCNGKRALPEDDEVVRSFFDAEMSLTENGGIAQEFQNMRKLFDSNEFIAKYEGEDSRIIPDFEETRDGACTRSECRTPPPE